MARRLGEDRRVRRAAAAAGAAAAAVEDRELDVALAGQRGQRLLGAVVLPGRGQVAAVLARVGVAEHHLEPPPAALDERAELRVVEQGGDGRGRLAEVGDRLEQRYEREVVADLLLRQRERPQQVVRAGGAGDDHGVERARAVAGARVANGAERGMRALVRGGELVRVQAHVELGDVEAEQLDAAAQVGERAVRDAGAAIGAQARVHQLEVGEQRAGVVVGRLGPCARANSRGACR